MIWIKFVNNFNKYDYLKIYGGVCGALIFSKRMVYNMIFLNLDIKDIKMF